MNERIRENRGDDRFGFGNFEEEFERMRLLMDAFMKEASIGNSEGRHGPFVYGFNIRQNPDGDIHMERFGNTGIERQPMIEEADHGERQTAESREPLTDVITSEDSVFITVEVPGVEKKDIKLEVTNGVLTIRVDSEDRHYYKEIELPCKVDPDSSQATYNHGVLDITFKRIEGTEKKTKIEVE